MSSGEQRVLILAPTGNDAAFSSEFLKNSGIRTEVCPNFSDLCERLERGCGAILLAEEALGRESHQVLLEALQRQPAWSDVPIAIITAGGGDPGQWRVRHSHLIRSGSNIALLERPFRADTLIRTIEVALRARERQYQIRDLVVQLRSSEERFRLLADNIAQLAWMADSAGAVHWYNKRWYEYTGTTWEEMQSGGWRNLHDPAHAEQVMQKFREHVAAGKNWEDTFPLRGRDGRYRWFLSRAFPIRDESGRVRQWFGTNTDITAQREAEGALREKQQRLGAALNAASTGTFIWHLPTNSFEWDENLDGLLGDTGAGDSNTLEHFLSRAQVDDRSRMALQFEESARTGADLELEFRVFKKEGCVRWIYVKGRTMRGAETRPDSVVGACVDVTERKLAEAAQIERTRLASLREEIAFILSKHVPLAQMLQECVELMVEKLGAALARVWTLNHGTDTLELQASAGSVSDLEDRDLRVQLGDGKVGFIAQTRQPHLTNSLATDPHVRDPEWARREGLVAFGGYPLIVEERTVGVIGFFSREPVPRAILEEMRPVADGVAQCIERKRAEAALEAHARRAELLSAVATELLKAESTPVLTGDIFRNLARELDIDIFVHFRLSGEGTRLVLADSLGLDATQIAACAKIRENETLCGQPPRSPRGCVSTELQKSDRCETELIRRLGARACACYPLQAGQRLLGTFSFASRTRDTFDDEELRLMHTLADLVASGLERTQLLRDVRKARDAAERASVAKDDFLAALSHELRTPLSPILLLASDAASNPDLSAEVRDDFAVIGRNVALEARLIDDLLDLTRITRGKLALDLQVIDAHEIIADALATVARESNQKRIVLKCDFRAQHPEVQGDAVRLQQVFWNVLRNAVKFTPEGGRITVETFNPPEGREITIQIVDSGIGLTPEELARVFESFAQGDHAAGGGSHRFGGLGLGLAISRMLVELHGGRIRAESAGRELGATFLVTFPVAGEPAGAPDLVDLAPSHGGDMPGPMLPSMGIPLLLVEDHETTRVTLTHLLKRRGFVVSAAATLAEARAVARSGTFPLLVSDIGLPDGNGYDLMEELAGECGIVGIALTGYGADADLLRSKAAGFVAHLTKPIRVQALEDGLDTALRAIREGRPASCLDPAVETKSVE